MFDPTGGADVVLRLIRDARINIVLGMALPYVMPALFWVVTALFEPAKLASTHTLIWATAAWTFLPASLLMRGVAMHRVASMIAERRRKGARGSDALVTA